MTEREELIEKVGRRLFGSTVDSMGRARELARLALDLFEQSPNGYQSFGAPQYADSATVLGIAEQIAGENAELMDRLADAPNDDEREVLVTLINAALFAWDGDGDESGFIADRILSGFRRPVQGEPTDSGETDDSSGV